MTHISTIKSSSKLLEIVANNLGCGCFRCGMVVHMETRHRGNSAFVV